MNYFLRNAILSLAVAVLLCACGKKDYMDASLPVEQRVNALMQLMTLEEKVGQMCQYVGPDHIRESEKRIRPGQLMNSDTYSFYPGMTVEDVENLAAEGKAGSYLHVVTAREANKLQSLAMKSRLKIPLIIGIDAIHGNALVSGCTVYPSPITLASTWDDDLVREISRQTALEMRAMGAHWTFTPNVDIARDPRWGRFGETAGEDTYLVGRMGAAQVEGLQQGDYTGTDKVIACAKHMIGGGDPINGTNAATTDISERTLYEMHLPPYEKAVREAGVYTVMMAHNELNGVPCHNNSIFMNDILRREYGLKGFVVSDWMDIERLRMHGVVATEDDAFVESVSNGMDMHMHGPGFFESIVEGVRSGRIKESRVDEACAKILEAKFRLGLFEAPFVEEDAFADKVYTQAHVQTALDAARKGIILLENRDILPLGKQKKVFLTGLNADNHSILGDWSLRQPEENVVTIRTGLETICREKGVAFSFFDCGEMVSRHEIPDKSDAAVRAARGADVAVIAVGENNLRYHKNATCGENIDRAGLGLLNNQQEMVQKIKAAGIPVVVVFVSGRPLTEEWISENADAVVWAWEPGCMGGRALAEILFGEVNPSGKLPATIPRHVGQTKIYYNTKPFHYFHRPIDIKRGALYDFGYGMSYTEYVYSGLRLSSSSIARDGSVTVSVEVTNSGEMAGDEIVQLYIRDNVSRVTRPVRELKGYGRVTLGPGETKCVEFALSTRDLAYYGPDMELIAEKGIFTIMAGGSSRDSDLLSAELVMTENEYFK